MTDKDRSFSPVSEPEDIPLPEEKEEAELTRELHQTAFPIARVKKIMKEDKDLSALSQDAIFLVTAATVRLHA